MNKKINPVDKVRGEISMPGDKSISHRVALVGSIAWGKTEARNFLRAEDCMQTVSAMKAMGVEIELEADRITINGKGLSGLVDPNRELFLGNSGTTMRILPGILAGSNFEVTLSGDESLSKRPMTRIIDPLKKMGVDIRSKKDEGLPPIVVCGGNVKPIEYTTRVASAQVKSCILLAGLHADGITRVTEPFMSRDHTERILEFCGGRVSRAGLTVSLKGKISLQGRDIFIPGDMSSGAFFIAAACLLEGSDVVIRNVGLNPTRTGFVGALLRMGANISVIDKKDVFEPYGDIRVRYARLEPVVIEEKEVPILIDEIPILAVVASRAEGVSRIDGLSELRVKETDRINALMQNLKLLGVDVREEGDGLLINGGSGKFKRALMKSYGDHRTAMSMSIAALLAEGDCKIENVDCINTSFPDFFSTLESIS